MTKKIEYDIDCMKYRKSTHLASVDVEMIIEEKGECLLTIEKCRYETGCIVNGKKVDGYFIKFVEPVKEMKANSINRKSISKVFKTLNGCTSVESRKISNWGGLKIKLWVDEKVNFGSETVSGIRVYETIEPQAPKKTLQDALIAFNSVSSRDTFVACMKDYSEFMQVKEVIAHCQKLAILYPKPNTKTNENI